MIRCSDDELEQIKMLADADGKSVSEYVRGKVLVQTAQSQALYATIADRLDGLEGAINDAQRLLGRR